MRNLSVALAISMVAFGPAGVEIALIIAVAYVIPVQAAAWYVIWPTSSLALLPERRLKARLELTGAHEQLHATPGAERHLIG